MTTHDAIIVGAGHNGLVCGAYLAKAGLKVLVVERREVIGGAAVTEEIAPGFRASRFSYVMSLLHPKVIRELELARHGLKILPANDLFSPLPDGQSITFSDDIKKTQASFARFSRHDAEIYPAFDAYIQEAANVVRKLLLETPVDPTRRDWRSIKRAAGLLWRHRRIGDKFYRIVDLLTQSAYDYVSTWFESDIVKAIFCYYASIGTAAGPRSPGSAYVIMHHIMGEHEGAGGWGFVRGGMGGITQAIAAAGREAGLEIATGAGVRDIIIKGGRAVGVTTTEGREFHAKAVISNANAKTLFQKLVPSAELPPEFLAEIAGFRAESTAFKMNIACHEPPRYRAFDAAREGFAYPTYVHIGPDIEYLERAWDDAKYGWYSAKPFITPVVPTFVDDTLAPPGKHVVNLFGGHAPHTLRNATWEAERESFKRNVLAVMEEYAPGFSERIIAMDLLLPPDLEAIVGLPTGHIFHGELSADQLFFQRPAAHFSDYRTPIEALYQCGSSTHPGGGVSGIPGHNAAREFLKDWAGIKRRAA